MRLLFEMVFPDFDPAAPAFVRHSARGILIRDGRAAMVHSRKYDYYKFPGGGIEPGESPVDALLREVREEAGLVVLPNSIREYGLVHRAQKSDSREGMFVQDNYYYLCEAEETPTAQDLDDYEREEGYTLEWVMPQAAISANRTHPHGVDFFSQAMLEREARVLELLQEEGFLSGKFCFP